MTQRAWNYMTDSFRTTLYLRFQPHTIACAAVMLAARDTETAMPHSPPWWLLFDADRQGMRAPAFFFRAVGG